MKSIPYYSGNFEINVPPEHRRLHRTDSTISQQSLYIPMHIFYTSQMVLFSLEMGGH